MKKFLKKVSIFSLVLCLALALFILPVACSDDNADTKTDAGVQDAPKPEKKAIIILPGIMGSNIVDTTTGDPLWAPLSKGLKMWDLNGIADYMQILKKPEVRELLNFDSEKGAYNWINKMKVNADGTVNNPNSPQIIDDEGNPVYEKSSTYGTLEYYEKAYFYLKENFGDKYDVRMFEYDWRLNNQDSAIALEKFINDHEYTHVTFVAHSMGGVLASTYIARSEANQAKVEKFISLGTPFFGSHKAVRVIDNPLSMVGDSADMGKMLETVKSLIDSMNGKGAFDKFFSEFMQFVYDLPTIYQLMPYADMCKAYVESDPELASLGIITIDGKPVTDYNEFINFLKSRGYINERCVGLMEAWQNEQYVTVDGVKKHASEVVNTYYFVGNELDTELCVNFVDDAMTDCTLSKQGDGTVPLYSALCGHNLTDKNVYEFKGVSHGNLVYDDICLEKIKEVING